MLLLNTLKYKVQYTKNKIQNNNTFSTVTENEKEKQPIKLLIKLGTRFV